ncbi:uncharacterized protein LOC133291753 [Gastrolobium bilobum]|uniref:uncharacterized protein LOC133291753 n=1 Tax=Gastrolobium bilobum TaxID=150636 RepID=UPI002AB03904|nr:uncharacterized protein LOC133291753 [Gastrolobium bilobum]
MDSGSEWKMLKQVGLINYILFCGDREQVFKTAETPFRLTYGCEAIISVEIGELSWRRMKTLKEEEEEKNNEALAVELDLIDEVRVQDMATKQLIAAKYNRIVKSKSFEKDDLVLRRADIGNKNVRDGKLAANWEGPYKVKEKLGKGAYILETIEKKPVKRTWNTNKLNQY